MFVISKKKKRQRHKVPDRRDRQQNKMHQTPIPKLLQQPLITSFSIQIQTVNLLSLRKTSIYVPFTGYCEYSGKKERKHSIFSEGKGVLTSSCAFAAYMRRQADLDGQFGRQCSAVSKIA